MINKYDLIDGGLILTGGWISLQDLQNVLSIVILCVDILWILIKIIFKIKKYLKDGILDPNEIKDIDQDLNKIKDHIKGGDKDE